ncbi:MAG: aminoacyl-tRNA hydrolase [bacterium]|jgi:PTH1 family peptidyl-tRNA hydrolase
MKMIAGLGNPGAGYAFTRHNLGFRVLDLLGKNGRVPLNRYIYQAMWGRGNLWGQEVILAKPLTYMNRSGQAVALLLRYFGIGTADLLVICDDVNLPLGKIRLRPRGSAGGHNGVASIIDHLGTEDFPRLRLGIGSPPDNITMPDYVLAQFPAGEKEEVALMLHKAGYAVELFLQVGLTAAMNKVNSPEFCRAQG